MFTTLVIGIDDQPSDAEPLARRLADPGARIIVARISEIDAQPGSGDTLYFDAAEVRDNDRFVGRFAQRNPGTEAISEIAASVGEGLQAVAEHVGADVIVIGSSRRGPLGRVLGGDAVHSTLRFAHCPVAIAPIGYDAAATPLARIVVGHDGGAAAEAALMTATGLRKRDRAQLDVIDVVEPLAEVGAGVHATYLGALELNELEAARLNVALVEQRTGADGHVVSGSAAAELSTFARSADLLAIGFGHRGLMDRILHGSATHALLRDQRTPLLVVPVPRPVAALVPDA